MLAPWSPLAFSVVLLLTTYAEAQRKAFITTEAEVITECKTCPRSLCTNLDTYSQGYGQFNVSCWTKGTKIMGDDLWLKTDKGCYVTQYDVLEYAGDYTTDLAYCGRASEEQHLTIVEATTKYKSECRISLGGYDDTIAYLREDTDLNLVCWTPDGNTVIDDPIWFKTTNNCYVAQKQLYSKPDITYLDPCGPIPHLETATHNNENGTSEVNKRYELEINKRNGLEARNIISLKVGEEYAYCRSCPADSCELEKTWEFDQEVWAQCLVWGSVNGTQVWTLTTDFCYMKSEDFWVPPEATVRFAGCDLYTVGGPGDDGDE